MKKTRNSRTESRKRSERKLHRKKRRIIFGFVASLIFLCLAGGVMIAKYYAGRSNKGVATASGLYFSSNLLKNVHGLDEKDYPAIYNSDAWDGTSPYSFNLKIQNYQNQLLYNDQNLDITYKISFKLLGETDGGTYQVTYKDETKSITSGTACEFTDTLAGGQATSNQFSVSIARPTGNTDLNYRSVGILVTATPVSPSYVANSEKLGGILYASMVSVKYELQGSFVNVGDNVSQYAGFPYTVTYKPGEDNAAHKIRITWEADKLLLDQYSPYYASIQQDGETKKYIEITLDPYTSLDIVFYRASGFGNITTGSELNELVEITDQDKQ